ncbi:hypothetical protein MKSMC1_48420 [Mycobacterium kansasii]|nr:hypothetical protein MKSMC1_48420 [Mycobacterium kansasii]
MVARFPVRSPAFRTERRHLARPRPPAACSYHQSQQGVYACSPSMSDP